MQLLTNKPAAIKASKTFRQRLDEILQQMKSHGRFLRQVQFSDEHPVEGLSEVIAQHTLSVRDLESAIMRQGMTLKAIGNPNPYPESKDPTSSKVEPTSDGLKL